MTDFQASLAQLRKEHYWDQLPIQPDVDEKGIDDGEDFKVEEDLSKGAVLKAVLQEGSGDFPAKQDLVYLHVTLIKSGQIVASTRQEYGGQGHANAYLLGQSQDLLKGIELAVLRMKPGERASLEIKPSYAYQHPKWTAAVPVSLRPDEALHAEVELVEVVPGRKVSTLHGQPDTYKILTKGGDEWETPRAPYRVTLHVTARPCSVGGQGGVDEYFATAEGAPLQAVLGSGALPPGLDAAVTAMVRGESSTVSCPRSAASGASGIPDPPSSSEAQRIDFEVTLVDFVQIRDLSGDGQMAVDMAVRLMLCGETSLVTCSWEKAFHREADAPEGLRPGGTLEFEVTMIDFHRDTIREDTTLEERVEIATKWKDQGNQLFKRGELKLAKAKYLKAARVMERTGAPDDATHMANVAVQVSCYLNMALCALKQQEAGEAMHYTGKTLEFDPGNAKAYFRRAQALALLGNYEEAAQELDAAAALDGGLEAEVAREKAKMAVQQKQDAAKQRAQFGKFFKS
ncbi:hypothetical protein QBZ16_003569 [Prototheca wickerhamii]|uniref:peptidylprolyl isomerase n=1 Tax=Prototheca wickerhamii TaxID=3111 RepID=A0AAD9IK83_PROWI|nr:hypothetical protein QBZ16_003569 [Prototheca wickerhamii]